jgi:hypothetical protein
MELVKIFKTMLNEQLDVWGEAKENTEVFEVSSELERVGYNTLGNKIYIQGCKFDNEITEISELGSNRQLIGNVYQSVCKCNKCGRHLIFDEHKFQIYKNYMRLVKGIAVE